MNNDFYFIFNQHVIYIYIWCIYRGVYVSRYNLKLKLICVLLIKFCHKNFFLSFEEDTFPLALFLGLNVSIVYIQEQQFTHIHRHSCTPSSLAPDPIMVQLCVCCLFWTNRNCMAVACIFLSISLSNKRWILISAL